MSRSKLVQKGVLLFMVALPIGAALAQPGYSFRPMEDADGGGDERTPGWRPSNPPAAHSSDSARPIDDHMGYRFAPRQEQKSAVPVMAPPFDGSSAAFRYKPEEETALQPPPLPEAIDPSKEPAMQGYGVGSVSGKDSQAGSGQTNLPGRYPMLEPPSRPSFTMERPTRGESPARLERPGRPEPPPIPQPLRLEGRYIDDASRYQQHSYPFRPLEEEKPRDSKTSSGTRPVDPVARAPSYQYPPMPMAPAYPHVPYDPGYNSGPSFNGFRFPFGTGTFPFSFK